MTTATARARHATQVRSRRAEIKRRIKAGEIDVPALLEGDAGEDVETTALEMAVTSLIAAIDGIGLVAVGRICGDLPIHAHTRLNSLTIAQRRALAERIRKELQK